MGDEQSVQQFLEQIDADARKHLGTFETIVAITDPGIPANRASFSLVVSDDDIFYLIHQEDGLIGDTFIINRAVLLALVDYIQRNGLPLG